MHRIRKEVAFAKEHGLFKAASAFNVTYELLQLVLNLKERSAPIGSSALYDSLPEVSQVDFFISHSWSCPSWMKTLALCHFLNLDLAIGSSSFACVAAASFLVWHAGSVSGVAQLPQPLLYGSLMCWPMAVFLLAYLFGHIASSTSFWFDRICVDQVNSSVKAQTLQAIPAFVAQSTQMLVLWDDTYVDRLWCNYEISVHAKWHSSPSAMPLVPMWMPLWTLSWISLYTLVNLMYFGQNLRTQRAAQLDLDSRSSLFASMVHANFVPAYIYLLTALPFSWFCIRKLESHKLMLDQMAHFDLRNAKCSVESDRQLIEQSVLHLFDEALEPPLRVAFDACDSSKSAFGAFDEELDAPLFSPEAMSEIRHITSYPTPDEVINQFNAYVRGPLRDSVLNSMGREDYISFKLCILVSFPWWLHGLIIVLGCDAHADCERAASYFGFQSVMDYMVTNAAMHLLLAPLVNAISYPMMLRTNHWVGTMVGSWYLQLLVGSLCSSVAVFLLDHFGLYLCGVLLVVVNKYSHLWMTGFLLGFTVLLWVTWLLFRQSMPQRSQRSLAHEK